MNPMAGSGDLLLSHPGMTDPHFCGSVVLIVEHGEEGTLGLILNKPVGMITEELDGGEFQTVYRGGPVEKGSVWALCSEGGDETRSVLEGVHWGNASQATKRSPRRFFLGYAGWDAGQLEGELAMDGWMVVPATQALVFDGDPGTLWARLLSGAGPEFAWVGALIGDPSRN